MVPRPDLHLRGVNSRYLVFFKNQDYNSRKAHAYIKRHHAELEPFFVNSVITETAAFAIEYKLIEHFKRRSEGGLAGVPGTRLRRAIPPAEDSRTCIDPVWNKAALWKRALAGGAVAGRFCTQRHIASAERHQSVGRRLPRLPFLRNRLETHSEQASRHDGRGLEAR